MPKAPTIPDGVSLTKQRAYLSDITVSLGLFNVPCAFVPAKAADTSTKFRIICPHGDHGDEAVPPAQRYICEGHTAEDTVRAVLADASLTKAADLRAAVDAALLKVHGPYSSSEAARAREVDKVLHKVTAEEIGATKESTDPDIVEGQMALQTSPRGQVTASVLPSGIAYRLRPRNGAFQAYAILMDAISATGDEYAVYGEVIARGEQKLFLLSVFTDAAGTRQIIAQESLRPGDMAELDRIEVAYSEAHAKMARELIVSSAVDFDPESYVSQRKVRAEELDERLRTEGGGTVTSTTATRSADPSNGGNALLASLEASLAATKKPARKLAS
jgi:hypothetical protein